MKRPGLAILAAAALAAPLPLAAQDNAPPGREALAEMEATLSDPAKQQEVAATLRVLGEILLDMPLAALADAAARITGEAIPEVSPNTTLRSMAPEASRLPEQIERNAPRAMAAAGELTQTLEAMLPALRDMAKQIEEAAPPAR